MSTARPTSTIVTTKQVAERLGISGIVVRHLAKRGVLTDVKPRKEGAGKHYPNFNLGEVRALAKVYKQFRGLKVTSASAELIRKAMTNGNASEAVVAHEPITTSAPAKRAALPRPQKTESPADGLLTRLARVEEKLDRLLQIWS